MRIVAALAGRLQDEVIEGDQSYSFGKVNDSNDLKSHLSGQITIHDPGTYIDFVKGGSIGAAEAFIANKWSSTDLTKVIRIFARAQNGMAKSFKLI